MNALKPQSSPGVTSARIESVKEVGASPPRSPPRSTRTPPSRRSLTSPSLLTRLVQAQNHLTQHPDPEIGPIQLLVFDAWRPVSVQAFMVEHAVKGPVWDCQMCGQCVLHETGMTCPMTCPKTLRNGPCGGGGVDGACEAQPAMQGGGG